MLTLAAPPRYRLLQPFPEVAVQLAAEAGIQPLTAQVLLNRGIDSAEGVRRFIDPLQETWHDPRELHGMPEAAAILAEAVRQGDIVCIHGDYDCDGVSATALLVSFLRDIGGRAIWYIPHRIDEGYGISLEGVQWAYGQDARVLITVDCGTSSPDEIAAACDLGMKVIVTDHHRVPPVRPKPHALVNPSLPECRYPFKKLSGVGVALKLAQATARELGLEASSIDSYVELATLGTVGDVVPLIGENRLLVASGLQRINRLPRPGIAALIAATGCTLPVSARDVAFRLVPPINATGRLHSAERAVELLLETDPDRALVLAEELVGFNNQRREIEAELTRRVRTLVLETNGYERAGLIIAAGDDWHRGVIGIVASRLVDEFGVPAFVISLNDGIGKGSCRAPLGMDLFECLSKAAHVLPHFGGHPRAGGFTVEEDNLEELRRVLGAAVAEQKDRSCPELPVDALIRLDELTLDGVRELERLSPFGESNPEPLFLVDGVRAVSAEAVKGQHCRFQARQGGTGIKAIWFGTAERPAVAPPAEDLKMLCHLEVDAWNGTERLSMRVRGAWPAGPEVPRITARPAGEASAASENASREERLVDSRRVVDRARYLQALAEERQVLLGLVRSAHQVKDLGAFHMCRDLAEASVLLSGEWPEGVFLPFGALKAEAAKFSGDVVLLAPPPSLSHLEHSLYRNATRIHVLFGERHLAEESGFYQASAVTQPKLEAIYRALRSLLRNGPGPVQAAEILALTTSLTVNRVAVEAGLSIFEELGLLRRETDGALCLLEGRRASLSESKTFARYSTLHDQYEHVQQIFARPTLDDLAEKIWRR